MSNSASTAQAPPAKYAWYRDLNRYQWFVLVVASLGWAFDTMAQQLFNIARVPAMRALLAEPGRLQAFREASRRKAAEFDLETVAGAYHDLFVEVVKGRD